MISEGAAIFFDDWDTNRSSPQFGQRRAWKELVARYRIDYSDHGEYGLGAHKFIVHSYRPGRAFSAKAPSSTTGTPS